MRFFSIFIIALIIFNLNSYSTNNDELRQKVKERLNTFKYDDFQKLQANKVIPESKNHLYNKAYNEILQTKKIKPNFQSKLQSMDSLPANFRTPGEFEESQAVFISWPSYAYDKDGNFVEPFTAGVGMRWFQNENGDWEFKTVDIAGYLLDLFEDSPYPAIWAKLAYTIQQEVPVWIRVAAPQDTTNLKAYVKSIGFELTNYVFKIDEDGENAFWARDFGPFGVYYGDEDSLMFVIAEYYPGRPIDDNYPIKLAEELGYKYYKSPVELEGGNFMCDGHGIGIYGDVVYANNSDDIGHAYTNKNPMGTKAVNQEMSRIFNLSETIIPTSLKCDGGTGHIDIYSKIANDEEILITKYPKEFQTTAFSDYFRVENNKSLILSKQNHYGKKYRFLEVPLPTDDNGLYTRTTCTSFNEDARGYINGLFVNKTFIVPIFSNSNSGNKKGDDEALNIIRKNMPGYKVVGIDSRVLTPGGGAIHCITMQIPAENPVYIQHSQLKGTQIESEVLNDGKIKIAGSVRNHSGFKNGKLFYRCTKKSDTWQEAKVEIVQKENASKSDFTFDSYINYKELNYAYGDDIEYYLSFETNNGKTAYRPISAPEGFYTFNVGDPTNVAEQIFNNIELYPNPADNYLYIKFNELNSNSDIEVYDIIGTKIANMQVEPNFETISLDLSKFNSGLYFLKITIGNDTRIMKFIVSK